MCTVTFIPRDRGFLLGMNRDEQWERGRKSFPPTVTQDAIFPRDEKGGTWIAVNAFGMAFAILNRNGTSFSKTRSRGDVIPQLLRSDTLSAAYDRTRSLQLEGTLSFTLLIFSSEDQQVSEQVWDGQGLSSASHPWALRHWFSSGLSDEEANRHRSRIVLDSESEVDFASPAWLRRLHRTHGNAPGPFSICVHREQVGSVSYTEVTTDPEQITMSYLTGPPCQNQSEGIRLTLPSARQAPIR
jgi:hypothetical protein